MELQKYLQHIQYSQARPIWIARLSNGESYYQDDGRPGAGLNPAWIRLGEKCQKESLDIVGIDVQYRKRFIPNVVPENAPAYFFVNSIVVDVQTNEQVRGLVFGSLNLESGDFAVNVFRIPDLQLFSEEPRKPEVIKPRCVIANSHGKEAVGKMSFSV